MRLWRNDPATPEGKYPLVLRRDGSALEKPFFVIVLHDPCAADALRAYAAAAERNHFDPAFVADLRALAERAADLAQRTTTSDPDAPPHRTDDPTILQRARDLGCPGA